MVCSSCGAPNSDDSNACEKCGKLLTQGFQIFPQLPANATHPRPPAALPRLLPFGVGGWLALLVVSVIVFCPIQFGYRALSEVRLLRLGGFDPLGPALYRGADAVICLALAVWGIFTGWSLLDLHRDAGKWAETYIAVVGVYFLIGYVLVRLGTPGCYLAYAGTAFTGNQLINSCVATILWIGYLRKSKRVANTFGPRSTPAVA